AALRDPTLATTRPPQEPLPWQSDQSTVGTSGSYGALGHYFRGNWSRGSARTTHNADHAQYRRMAFRVAPGRRWRGHRGRDTSRDSLSRLPASRRLLPIAPADPAATPGHLPSESLLIVSQLGPAVRPGWRT